MDVDSAKPYIIGETAYNHEGDIDYLHRMIADISDLELNAVKFHLILNPDSYMTNNHPLREELKKWIFNEREWDDIISFSNEKRLDVIALCDDVESLEYIFENSKNVNAIEIHSSALNDHFLLRKSAEFQGVVILGIGSSTIDEIAYAVDFLGKNGKTEILLMYGFQSYPTSYVDINLSKMLKIRDLFSVPVGYADHTAFDDPNNEIISVMGAMMGINILEKHYTPDYGVKRIDYHAAVSRKQMSRIKELMNLALETYGNGDLQMSKSELESAILGPMKKAIVARIDIRKGEKLSIDNLWFKRTKELSHLKQNQFLQLVGLEANKDIKKDEVVDFSKVNKEFNGIDLKASKTKGEDQ